MTNRFRRFTALAIALCMALGVLAVGPVNAQAYTTAGASAAVYQVFEFVVPEVLRPGGLNIQLPVGQPLRAEVRLDAGPNIEVRWAVWQFNDVGTHLDVEGASTTGLYTYITAVSWDRVANPNFIVLAILYDSDVQIYPLTFRPFGVTVIAPSGIEAVPFDGGTYVAELYLGNSEIFTFTLTPDVFANVPVGYEVVWEAMTSDIVDISVNPDMLTAVVTGIGVGNTQVRATLYRVVADGSNVVVDYAYLSAEVELGAITVTRVTPDLTTHPFGTNIDLPLGQSFDIAVEHSANPDVFEIRWRLSDIITPAVAGVIEVDFSTQVGNSTTITPVSWDENGNGIFVVIAELYNRVTEERVPTDAAFYPEPSDRMLLGVQIVILPGIVAYYPLGATQANRREIVVGDDPVTFELALTPDGTTLDDLPDGWTIEWRVLGNDAGLFNITAADNRSLTADVTALGVGNAARVGARLRDANGVQQGAWVYFFIRGVLDDIDLTLVTPDAADLPLTLRVGQSVTAGVELTGTFPAAWSLVWGTDYTSLLELTGVTDYQQTLTGLSAGYDIQVWAALVDEDGNHVYRNGNPIRIEFYVNVAPIRLVAYSPLDATAGNRQPIVVGGDPMPFTVALTPDGTTVDDLPDGWTVEWVVLGNDANLFELYSINTRSLTTSGSALGIGDAARIRARLLDASGVPQDDMVVFFIQGIVGDIDLTLLTPTDLPLALIVGQSVTVGVELAGGPVLDTWSIVWGTDYYTYLELAIASSDYQKSLTALAEQDNILVWAALVDEYGNVIYSGGSPVRIEFTVNISSIGLVAVSPLDTTPANRAEIAVGGDSVSFAVALTPDGTTVLDLPANWTVVWEVLGEDRTLFTIQTEGLCSLIVSGSALGVGSAARIRATLFDENNVQQGDWVQFFIQGIAGDLTLARVSPAPDEDIYLYVNDRIDLVTEIDGLDALPPGWNIAWEWVTRTPGDAFAAHGSASTNWPYSHNLEATIAGAATVRAVLQDNTGVNVGEFVYFTLIAQYPLATGIDVEVYDDEPAEVIVGETLTLVYTFAPSGSVSPYGSVEWRSSNDNIATVDANGVVTAISPGTVYIYAEILDNDGDVAVYGYIQVTVYPIPVPAIRVPDPPVATTNGRYNLTVVIDHFDLLVGDHQLMVIRTPGGVVGFATQYPVSTYVSDIELCSQVQSILIMLIDDSGDIVYVYVWTWQ